MLSSLLQAACNQWKRFWDISAKVGLENSVNFFFDQTKSGSTAGINKMVVCGKCEPGGKLISTSSNEVFSHFFLLLLSWSVFCFGFGKRQTAQRLLSPHVAYIANHHLQYENSPLHHINTQNSKTFFSSFFFRSPLQQSSPHNNPTIVGLISDPPRGPYH